MARNVAHLIAMAAALALCESVANGTRTFDFEGAAYGNPDELCANHPVPPLFNRPEYGYGTSSYVWGAAVPMDATTGCGHGVIGGDFGSDSVLTAEINGTNSNVLRFSWEDPANNSSWARVSTASFSYVIPLFPSPTVHIGAGSRVSMKIAIHGLDATEIESPSGQLEFSLCVRETGLNLPLGEDGGTTATVEFVGVETKGVGTDANTPIGGTMLTHSSTFTWTTVEWQFVDDAGTIKVDVRINGGAPVRKPIVPLTGDGILSAPNDRGTLDSLAIRKPAADAVTKKWFVWIDDIVIDAPFVVDPVVITGPVRETSTRLTVASVDPAADELRLYIDSTLVATATPPYSDPANNAHEFTGLAPLIAGQVLTATQIVDGTESPPSQPVVVSPQDCHVIEDFNGPTFQRSPSPTPSGKYRTWYDVSSIVWAGAERATLEGSPAMKISDGGWTNGVYAIFPNVFCMTSVYHVEVKMHIVENAVTDGLRSYEIGVAVPGAHRDPNGILPPCSIVGRYQGLTIGDDTAKGPQIVKTQDFAAEAGQDILIAFSTDVTSGAWNANSATWDDTYVLVDDIVLVEHTCCITCSEVPAVEVIGPLVAGDTVVRVANVGEVANLVTVYVNGLPKGQLDTRAEGGGTKAVTIGAPLAVGDLVRTTQSYPLGDGTDIEGCAPTTTVMAGSGLNPGPLRLALGVRETGTSALIGADGGVLGPIEWLGAVTVINGAPLGIPLAPSYEWQTVIFDPTSPPIIPGEGGNGVINGGFLRRLVIESLAIRPDPNALDGGPYALYIDNIKSGSTLLTGFEEYPPGTQEVFFRKPRYLLSTRNNLMLEPNLSVVDGSHGDASSRSLQVEFQLVDQALNRWLRLTTYSLYGNPSPYLANPTVWSDRPITMRILYVAGSPADADQDGDVDLLDFAQFQPCFNGPNRPFPNENHCTRLDLDADGDVDLLDFAQFQACFNGPNRPSLNPE